jgi:hypothetical protein
VSLLETTTAIEAALTARLTALSLAVPTYHFGRSNLELQEDAPRIVWVPKQGSADGKIIHGADSPADYGHAATYPNPRPLWRRVLTVEAHVWGLRADLSTSADLDFGAAETLANHLVAAIQKVTFGPYEMRGENWDTPLTNQGASTARGKVVVLTVALFLPWTDELDTLATVTAMPVTVGSAHVGA